VRKKGKTVDDELKRMIGQSIAESLRSKDDFLRQTARLQQKKNTRAVRKVSGHFEYLENRSSGLDVAWEPARGDLTVHP